MPSQEQLKAWAESYLAGTISEEDKAALEAWYAALPDAAVNWDDPAVDSAGALKAKVFAAIDKQIGTEDRQPYRIYRRSMAAAAAVLLFVVSGIFYFRGHHAVSVPAVVTKAIPSDVQPGSTKAVLMLADGKNLPVNGSQPLNVTDKNGAVAVLDKDGKLNYLGTVASTNLYNTLVTHKGEQSPPLVLPDGTKVWLNAASTLRFPVIFAGKERRVFLSGEAYFEVTKNTQHPFIVSMGDNNIEVLGTSFDAMAYDDEPYTYATLLDGAIRVGNREHTSLLSPGQQSRTNAQGRILIGKVDVQQSIAWMKGQFPLNSMDTKRLLRQIGRWYDVNVVYKGEPAALSFSGSIDKNVPLSQLLAALSVNGIHCILKDKTVTVSDSPANAH